MYIEYIKNSRIIAGFTKKRGGVSRGSFSSLNLGRNTQDPFISDNIRIFLEYIKWDKDYLFLKQIHSSKVLDLDEYLDKNNVNIKDIDFKLEYDGIITTKRGVLLFITVADCGNLVFYNKDFSIIGALHAGWRGTSTGIIENITDLFIKKGYSISDINVYVGPMITGKNYEVGEEFYNFFDKKFLEKKAGKLFLHLDKVILEKLEKLGYKNIYNKIKDVYEEKEKFYSYRRDKITGRNAAFIGLY